MVARYGGEEFVIVMPQTELDDATLFCERLRRRVEQQLPLTVSGGVTAPQKATTRKRCWPAPMPHCIARKRPAAIACIATQAWSFRQPAK